MASVIYNPAKVSLGKAEIDWVNDTIKVSLHTSSYSANIDTDQYFSDLSNEVSGTGYSSGGFTLANTTVTQDSTNDRAIYDADDVSESGLTIASYRYAVVYQSTGVASTSRLICVHDFGTDYALDNGTLDIVWGAGGVFNNT